MIKSIDIYISGIIIPILFIHNQAKSPFQYEKSEMKSNLYKFWYDDTSTFRIKNRVSFIQYIENLTHY